MEKQDFEKISMFVENGLIDIIVSNSSDSQCLKKVKIRPVLIRKKEKYQVTSYQGTKVFHKNYDKEELSGLLESYVTGHIVEKPDGSQGVVKFRQIVLRTEEEQMNVLISKKQKASIKINKHKEKMKQETLGHNRSKRYILEEGTTVPFLVDLGVMTKEGKIVHAKYDKYRQINRFLEFVEDIVMELPKDREITILDFGCGKSYLTFALYHYLKHLKGYPIRIIGLDLKEDVIRTCNTLAEKYAYENLVFLQGNIADYNELNQVDMVVTLHACDTATDFALYKAVEWGAKVILSVPCCQHEVNKQISCDTLAPVLKYGLLKERMSALITDGLRAQLLESAGYKTQILEFIDMEHTPKNILIRAVRQNKKKISENKEYQELVKFLNIKPTLGELLNQNPPSDN